LDRISIPGVALRRFGFVATLIAALSLPHKAEAKVACPAGFPSKPIRFMVGFAAGGGTDVIARAVAKGMERLQGWVAPVENKPGAGGGVVASWIKTQPADGYTIGITSSVAVTINPALGNADFVWSDFDYLGSGMQTWSGFVALADKPYNNIAEFIEFARKNGRATISVSGSNLEAIVKQLATQYNVNLVPVPGIGASEAWATALGGHVDATMQGTLHVEALKSGKVKQLASLVDRRVPYAPNSQTMSEQGTNVPVLDSHTIFFIPKGVSAGIQKCLVDALEESIKTPEYNDLMVKLDNEALNLGPEGIKPVLDRSFTTYKQIFGKK
jgi:tripartite-type tricarboxylate transporter receptor subunit TctC